VTPEPRREDQGSADLAFAAADALANGIRAKILLAVADRSMWPGGDGVVTVRQVAARIGEPRRRVKYHLDSLVEQGLVAVAAEKRNRGAFERYYRHVECAPVRRGNGVSDKLFRKASLELLKRVFVDATSALSLETYEQTPEPRIVRLPAEVDEQGWEELAAAQLEAMAAVEGILSRASERAQSSTGTPVPVVFAILLLSSPRYPD
jgi:DNA-binding transcriptional ArsR family regulator